MPPRFSFTLCADDYAMTPGVSRGILEALDAGALTATSVMTTSSWWPEYADALRRHEARADIGLHLNLTLGAPLGPMPTLAPGGVLPNIATMMRYARRGTAPPREVADEIARQCDRFMDIFGRAPDHVDGHQHVHVLAGIRPLVFAALSARGWRPWLRDSADQPFRILTRAEGLKKALGLAVLARGFAKEAENADHAVNDGFAGFSRFAPADDYGRHFGRYLAHPGRRHLVMCHPGIVDDHLRRCDPVVESRERELSFLLSSDFRTVVSRANGHLTKMSRSLGR